MASSQRFVPVPTFLKPLLLLVVLGGCAPLIAEYSAEAYKNATTLKAEALAMVDRSGEPFNNRRKEVEQLSTRIDAAYEYVAGLPNNQISAQQWAIIRDPAGGSFGGFIALWKDQGQVSRAFRTDKKEQLARHFNYLICLEANKQAATSCSAAAKSNDR